MERGRPARSESSSPSSITPSVVPNFQLLGRPSQGCHATERSEVECQRPSRTQIPNAPQSCPAQSVPWAATQPLASLPVRMRRTTFAVSQFYPSSAQSEPRPSGSVNKHRDTTPLQTRDARRFQKPEIRNSKPETRRYPAFASHSASSIIFSSSRTLSSDSAMPCFFIRSCFARISCRMRVN